MARLTAAFGSSHSVMLAATLEDWLRGFRESDRRMPYYDAEGRRCSYEDLLARAPANAENFITAERSGALPAVQEAMSDEGRDRSGEARRTHRHRRRPVRAL